MMTHFFVNSDPKGIDSNCATCGGKLRDSVHGPTDALREAIHAGEWIALTDEVPPLKIFVEVKGAYMPDGHGYPLSYRRKDRRDEAERPTAPGRDWRWESTEWRGSVGITHWRYANPQNQNGSKRP